MNRFFPLCVRLIVLMSKAIRLIAGSPIDAFKEICGMLRVRVHDVFDQDHERLSVLGFQ